MTAEAPHASKTCLADLRENKNAIPSMHDGMACRR